MSTEGAFLTLSNPKIVLMLRYHVNTVLPDYAFVRFLSHHGHTRIRGHGSPIDGRSLCTYSGRRTHAPHACPHMRLYVSQCIMCQCYQSATTSKHPPSDRWWFPDRTERSGKRMAAWAPRHYETTDTHGQNFNVGSIS